MQAYNIESKRPDALRTYGAVRKMYEEGVTNGLTISSRLKINKNTVYRAIKRILHENNKQPENDLEMRSVHSIGSKYKNTKVSVCHYDAYTKKIDKDGVQTTEITPAKSVRYTYTKDNGSFDLDAVLRHMKKIKPLDWNKKEDSMVSKANDGLVSVVCLFDAHIDKQHKDHNTASSNTFNDNKKRFMSVGMRLIDRASKYSNHIILPFGSDLFNHDGKNTTTAGTPQDSFGRDREHFMDIVQCCVDLTYYAINCGFKKVQIPVIRGNHDGDNCFLLEQFLRVYFKNVDNCTVLETSRLPFFGIKWGVNKIVFTHGDYMSPSKFLHFYNATERKDDDKGISVFGGHVHKEQTISDYSATYYTLRSLSCTDAWHYSKGYVSPKSGYCFIFDKAQIDALEQFKITER